MFKKTHDLNWLWERIKAEVPAKLGGDTWDGFDTGFIGKLVKDLHKADPDTERGHDYRSASRCASVRTAMRCQPVVYGGLLKCARRVDAAAILDR